MRGVFLRGALGALLIVGAVTAPALAGTVTRVSTDGFDEEANGRSWSPAPSADGALVAFGSEASNLVPGDTNGREDFFVKNIRSGAIERVNVAPGGGQGNAHPFAGSGSSPILSADGRYVVFASADGNLVAGDPDTTSVDVFVRDRSTATTTRLGGASLDTWNGGNDPSISPNGRWVAFVSFAKLTPSDTSGPGHKDVYRWDRTTDQLTLVSVTGAGARPAGTSSDTFSRPSVSDDGKVAFASTLQLSSADTDSGLDVYVRDPAAGTTTQLLASGGVQPNDVTGRPVISGNGAIVAFESPSTSFAANDAAGTWDVFAWTLAGGAVQRLSGSGATAGIESRVGSISQDGRYVGFSSNVRHGGDPDAVIDAFVKDRQGGIRWVSTKLGGTADPATGGSGPAIVSGDGLSATFQSGAANLVGADVNGSLDVYSDRPPSSLPAPVLDSPFEGCVVSGPLATKLIIPNAMGWTSGTATFTVDGVVIGTDASAPYEATWTPGSAPLGVHLIQASLEVTLGATSWTVRTPAVGVELAGPPATAAEEARRILACQGLLEDSEDTTTTSDAQSALITDINSGASRLRAPWTGTSPLSATRGAESYTLGPFPLATGAAATVANGVVHYPSPLAPNNLFVVQFLEGDGEDEPAGIRYMPIIRQSGGTSYFPMPFSLPSGYTVSLETAGHTLTVRDTSGEIAFRFDEPLVYDAKGTKLTAVYQLAANQRQLNLSITTTGAVYPIVPRVDIDFRPPDTDPTEAEDPASSVADNPGDAVPPACPSSGAAPALPANEPDEFGITACTPTGQMTALSAIPGLRRYSWARTYPAVRIWFFRRSLPGPYYFATGLTDATAQVQTQRGTQVAAITHRLALSDIRSVATVNGEVVPTTPYPGGITGLSGSFGGDGLGFGFEYSLCQSGGACTTTTIPPASPDASGVRLHTANAAMPTGQSIAVRFRWLIRQGVPVDYVPAMPQSAVPLTRISPYVRCQSPAYLRPRTGCEFRQKVPHQGNLASAYPQVADHISDAIANGAPSTLQRVVGRAVRRNRALACGRYARRTPRPPGMTCDEYPYASTAQGGAGASTRWVPAGENQAQGRALSAFYNRLRIFEFDAFTVGVVG